MPKILHTADIHLGRRFPGLGEKGASQREQVRTTFKNIAALAIDEKVDLVLIAGDLFDCNQQPQRNIELVTEQFKLLEKNGIPICLIPGTHDSLDSSSIYTKVNFEERCHNLKLFSEEMMSCEEYPHLDLTVYGIPNLGQTPGLSPLKGLKRLTSTKYHVAMVHGSLLIPGKVEEDEELFTAGDIQGSDMDYIALGHWHSTLPCSEKGVISWYSGAPEWLDWGQKTRAVLLVDISDQGETKVTPRDIGARHSDEIELDVADIKDVIELKSIIQEGANTNLLRKIELKGLRDAAFSFDLRELEEEFGNGFFSLRIDDKSSLRLDNISPEDYPDKPLIANFVRMAMREIEEARDEEKKIAEDVLQYGVAWLEGRGID
jgi:DNA repair exonuclease SbcCD nuclease subunit